MKVNDFSYFSDNISSLMEDKAADANYDLDIDLQKIGEELSSPIKVPPKSRGLTCHTCGSCYNCTAMCKTLGTCKCR